MLDSEICTSTSRAGPHINGGFASVSTRNPPGHLYHPCLCEYFVLSTYVKHVLLYRPAFSDSTDSGGEFNIMVAGEFGSFSPVRTGLEAGGRPLSSDGLATFGGVRALARYVKIEAVPASGGTITINEVRAVGCYVIPSRGRVLPNPTISEAPRVIML